MSKAQLLITVTAVVAIPSLALAAAGGHEPTLMDWVWKIVNFAILVFLLVKFLKRPVVNYFKERQSLIEKSLKESQEAKAIAEQALKEVQERLKFKDEEIKAIITAAKESGEREKARLIEEGERLKAKILQQAQDNIALELKKAKDIIKAEAASAALATAEQKVIASMTIDSQERLLQESLKMLEGKN